MEERLLEIKDLHVEYVTDEARVFAATASSVAPFWKRTIAEAHNAPTSLCPPISALRGG